VDLKQQIRQLTGMRGLMAKPKKSNSGGGEITTDSFQL
jgi:DNA-directed RNA polymerase subunit beta'